MNIHKSHTKVDLRLIFKSLKVYEELGHKIIEKDKQVRHHIDIIPEGTNEKDLPYGVNNLINFRFDLLDKSPYLQQFGHFTNKIEITDDFFDFILDRKIKKEFKWPVMFEQKGTFKANFPCETDDLVIRFMEYIHVLWVYSRP